MNFTCYIIDDEPAAVALLQDYIDRTPGLELVGYALDPVTALPKLTGPDAPDITFVDVDMRHLSGLELAGLVSLYTTVIFTTAFPQHALQAFEKEALDYLVKPIPYERFAKSMLSIRRRGISSAKKFQALPADYFTIKSDIKGRLIRIRFDEVIYIEGAANYISIHTTEGRHMTYLTIKEAETRLPRSLFSRIHRSFLINVNFVKIAERNQVRLKTGETLMLGKSYKQAFLDLMDASLIQTDR